MKSSSTRDTNRPHKEATVSQRKAIASDRFVDTSAILMLLSQSLLSLSRSIKRTPKHIVFNGAESAIN